jgi:hypothetical protein
MPNPIIARDWSDASVRWSEDHLQMAVVRELRRRGVLFAADFAAGRRNPGKAKAMGLVAGEPDLRIYLPGGRLVMVELKTDRGKVSAPQKARHAGLAALGYTVHVLRALTPAQAVEKIATILESEG